MDSIEMNDVDPEYTSSTVKCERHYVNAQVPRVDSACKLQGLISQ